MPTNTARNAIRSAVKIRVWTKRAVSVYGSDVAVTGCRQRHRGEVQAVQECQRLAPHIAVTIAVEVDNDGRGEQHHQRDGHAARNDADGAGVLFGDAQDADQLMTGLGGQRFIQTAELSRPTVAHGGPSSA